jgi:PPP family 3-phenylpropionic acid transporter
MLKFQGKPFTKDYMLVILYYLLFYAGGTVINNFMAPFLREYVQIGFLLATGPVASLLVQPFWGIKADRARYKNSVLIILLTGSLVAALLIPIYAQMSFPMHIMFWLIAGGMLLLNCFQTSNIPMSDAIMVELCQERGWDFGRLRIAASIGYSIMGLTAGILIGGVLLRMFPLYAGLSLLAIVSAFFIPRVPGRQREKIRLPYLELMKNRGLVKMVSISLVCSMTLSMHYSFYGIYFLQMGGTTAMLGMAILCSSIFELPFSMFSKRVIKKLGGDENAMLLALGVMSLRWLLASFARTPLQLLLINSLHGFSFVVITICVALYISENVAPELKASSMAFNGVASGLARILGSIGAGLLVSNLGVSVMFIVASFVNALLLVIFLLLRLYDKKRKPQI